MLRFGGTSGGGDVDLGCFDLMHFGYGIGQDLHSVDITTLYDICIKR
jgi:hypothetical protein